MHFYMVMGGHGVTTLLNGISKSHFFAEKEVKVSIPFSNLSMYFAKSVMNYFEIKNIVFIIHRLQFPGNLNDHWNCFDGLNSIH